MNLSVGLITHNEEKDLPRTLEAIKDIADEIIIVDSGSTDHTIDIARSYHAQIYHETWKGFGLQKNSVIDKCNGQWILLIDADEEVSEPLKERITSIILGASGSIVFKINFNTICFGKEIKHGGWKNYYRVRFFAKDSRRYDKQQVHEKFIAEESIANIKEKINHYSYHSLEDYLNKFNNYTTKSAITYHQAGKKKSVLASYFSSVFNFLKTYIFLLGFLDAYEGFLLSKLGAMSVLVKYAKLRELNNQK